MDQRIVGKRVAILVLEGCSENAPSREHQLKTENLPLKACRPCGRSSTQFRLRPIFPGLEDAMFTVGHRTIVWPAKRPLEP